MSAQSLERMVRSRDPETSWDAAESISDATLSELQSWVLVQLREDPRADHELVIAAQEAWWRGELPQVSGQRVRTSRKYLELAGMVRATGYFHLTESKRRAQVWEVVK